jgi:hypothetical protein
VAELPPGYGPWNIIEKKLSSMKIFPSPFVYILICYTPKKERIFEVNATCHRHRMTPKSPRGRLQPMTGVKEVAAAVQHGFLSYSLTYYYEDDMLLSF